MNVSRAPAFLFCFEGQGVLGLVRIGVQKPET